MEIPDFDNQCYKRNRSYAENPSKIEIKNLNNKKIPLMTENK